MKVTIEPKSTIDLKTLLSAQVDETVIVEWAEGPKDYNGLVYLVSTPDNQSIYDYFDGVVVNPDPRSVNHVRGVTVSANNIFVYNASTLKLNLNCYINK